MAMLGLAQLISSRPGSAGKDSSTLVSIAFVSTELGLTRVRLAWHGEASLECACVELCSCGVVSDFSTVLYWAPLHWASNGLNWLGLVSFNSASLPSVRLGWGWCRTAGTTLT